MEQEINQIKLAFFLGKVSQNIADLSSEISIFAQSQSNENDKKKIMEFVDKLDEIEIDVNAEELIEFCSK